MSVVFNPNAHFENVSAFDPHPCKSTIQVWRFPVNSKGKMLKPSLALAICHTWGHATTLKFRPHPEPLSPLDLGFLCGVFGDGKTRILRVHLPSDESPNADYCHFDLYTSAAYTLTLPVPITVAQWHTSNSIVVGTTSGAIAIFHLTDPDPKPSLYHPLHQTYITALTTCFPSFPNYIVTSSMDGHSRLTSLLAPTVDSP